MLGRVLIAILFLVTTYDVIAAAAEDTTALGASSTSTSSTTTTLAEAAPPSSPQMEALPSDWLNQGIQLYQKGSYPEAEKLFSTAVTQHPDEGRAYYNLGLVEFRLGHSGLALARWRQALFHRPHFPQARAALNFGRSQLPSIEGADFSTLWWAHTSALGEVGLPFFLLLEAIFLVFAGLSWIRYLKAKRNPENSAPIRAVRLLSLISIFVISTLILALKLGERTTNWGTVVTKNTAARTTSSEDSASLFEIAEGQEVIILRKENSWYEIQMPSEKVGWVAPSSILATAGE